MRSKLRQLWLAPRIKWHSAGLLIILAAVPISFTTGIYYVIGMSALCFLTILNTNQFVTRFNAAVEKIKQLNLELSRSGNLEQIDELSAGIAHEINNPLGIISQEIQWIQHLLHAQGKGASYDPDDIKDSLREIASQVARGKEIVSKLLNLAKDMEPVIQCVDINELIESLSNVVSRQATDRNISISKELTPNLPLVYTDPPLVRQVVLNLIVNAIHAVDQDGYINLSTKLDDPFVEISVEDSGCGIPKENLHKIFTPFFSTKPSGKGTGLGLAICRGIIERLGGEIRVESELGECTTFTIILPIIREIKEEV